MMNNKAVLLTFVSRWLSLAFQKILPPQCIYCIHCIIQYSVTPPYCTVSNVSTALYHTVQCTPTTTFSPTTTPRTRSISTVTSLLIQIQCRCRYSCKFRTCITFKDLIIFAGKSLPPVFIVIVVIVGRSIYDHHDEFYLLNITHTYVILICTKTPRSKPSHKVAPKLVDDQTGRNWSRGLSLRTHAFLSPPTSWPMLVS